MENKLKIENPRIASSSDQRLILEVDDFYFPKTQEQLAAEKKLHEAVNSLVTNNKNTYINLNSVNSWGSVQVSGGYVQFPRHTGGPIYGSGITFNATSSLYIDADLTINTFLNSYKPHPVEFAEAIGADRSEYVRSGRITFTDGKSHVEWSERGFSPIRPVSLSG